MNKLRLRKSITEPQCSHPITQIKISVILENVIKRHKNKGIQLIETIPVLLPLLWLLFLGRPPTRKYFRPQAKNLQKISSLPPLSFSLRKPRKWLPPPLQKATCYPSFSLPDMPSFSKTLETPETAELPILSKYTALSSLHCNP